MAEDTAKTNWPVFRSLASFRASDLPGDLIAGLTLAAIAIPEQMATARLGGFSPQIGFFAFIAGSLGFAALGSNRFLSCGADSTITPIFAGGLVLMAASGSPDYQALAMALALQVGAILVIGSLFRLGWIANLLSTPVTSGFLAGISVHILVSQMPGVLGLPTPGGPMLERIAVLARHLGEANLFTVAIGFGVLAVVAGSEAVSARIPGALIGLVAATAAVVWAGLESKGVKVVGAVPATLPACSARSRSTPARRGPASCARPADARNCPDCLPRQSCWRCWPLARRCCGTFRMRRSAACCCSWRCGSFAGARSWRSIASRSASSS